MNIRVYYEDTDAGGIVYHANYLKFCERARSEYFFSQNLVPIIDEAHFVVRKMDCDFISSAYFSDVLKVVSKIKEIKKASFIMTQEIKKDERLIFKTEVTLVLAKDGKPKRIDENIKDMLQSLFAKIE
ncbi:thioesterase family protein [Arcobacter sp. 15-2]|uniref:YbgC/FadM family acyl-CoA thioesterase n=1 Tax=Arcobacter sp. 15-2 TaxID=3374109 RepID=UPI00399D191F